MKRIIFLLVVVLGVFVGNVEGQYHIVSYTPGYITDTSASGVACSSPDITVYISGYSVSLTLQTYYGDGTMSVNPVISPGTVYLAHFYGAGGEYSIKHVLLLAGVAIDSITHSYPHLYCRTFNFFFYNDVNGNCTRDASESYLQSTTRIAVEKNGVSIDTFTCYSGIGYDPQGSPGDVFGFHIIAGPGFSVSCPASGIIYDTLSSISDNYPLKEIAFLCTGATSGYDASELVTNRVGMHPFYSHILVTNPYCTPTAVTLTMNLSPKYHYRDAYPPPSLILGHTITWNFPGLSTMTPQNIYLYSEVSGTGLMPGDTVHSSYYLTPLAGDSDTTNNTILIIDTVRGGWDPNDKTVSPMGYIAPGAETQLTYTLRFENTGNDTAFNIHIMDTLSDDLNVSTLDILGSSAVMNMAVFNNGPHNIVKFDFPSINLLDSSHHGQCDGMVRFTIKTNTGLSNGTQIDNRAGIYFDYNEVVMTNTVTNIVGTPVGIAEMSNRAIVDFELFPNPANSELTVKIAGAYNTISITNSIGQEVMKKNVSTGNNQLNIRNLPAGNYFISVRGENGSKVKMFQKM